MLVGDRFLILEAVRSSLTKKRFDVAVNGTGIRGIETAVQAFSPTVIVVDASEMSVEQAIRLLNQFSSSDQLVAMVVADEISVAAARLVNAGAAMVLGLNSALADVEDAVRKLVEGEEPLPLARRYRFEELMREYRAAEDERWRPFNELTAREQHVFRLVCEGLPAYQIADDACVSVNTVRSHIRSILTKLNVGSQLAAAALAHSNNWFETQPLSHAS